MNKNLPQVAIVGRTNAGKSTLFNRLSESHKAIISPLINTTRDRNFADLAWQGKIFTIVDTGGLDTAASDQLGTQIQKQVQLALDNADLILFLVDGSGSLMPQDRELAKKLHKLKKPVVLGINKIDNQKKELKIDPDFYKLNFNNIAKFSAINGSQTGDLLDLVAEKLPNKKRKIEPEMQEIKIAILGRPNVGKSSLINAILGQERVIVSDLAHTTRDINDVEFVYQDKKFTLIDTAGMRRKSKVGRWSDKFVGKIEKEGIQGTVRAMDEADIVVLVLEAHSRISSQDLSLVQLATSHRKNLLIVINKWDLVPDKDEKTIKKYARYFDNQMSFAKYAPMIFVSAVHKQRVRKILDLAVEINQQCHKKINEQDLFKLLTKVMNRCKPKQRQVRAFGQIKKDLILKRLIQTSTNPISFSIKSPTPKNVPPAIMKILEKEIREQYEFLGVPIRIEIL